MVLATGRPDDLNFNLINQISFRVPDLQNLRDFYNKVRNCSDITDVQAVTHGNAVSIYCRDPEGNRLEIFMDTPWYCDQPLREPVNLDVSDEEILAQAERIARQYPKFKPRSVWQQEMRELMGLSE